MFFSSLWCSYFSLSGWVWTFGHCSISCWWSGIFVSIDTSYETIDRLPHMRRLCHLLVLFILSFNLVNCVRYVLSSCFRQKHHQEGVDEGYEGKETHRHWHMCTLIKFFHKRRQHWTQSWNCWVDSKSYLPDFSWIYFRRVEVVDGKSNRCSKFT